MPVAGGPRLQLLLGQTALRRENKTVTPTIRMMGRLVMPIVTGQRFLQLLGSLPPDGMLELYLDMLDACTRMRV